MKILMIHNHYQQYGGEDAVAKAEYSLVSRYGHEVYFYERSNKEIKNLSPLERIKSFLNLSWSDKTYSEVRAIIQKFCPDVVHVYNAFFMVTPSVYFACRDEGVAVVQSLYNFRWLCANAVFLRKGKFCSECMYYSRWRSVLHGCYRNSSLLTAVIVKMLNNHWKKKTWINLIDGYITATEFSRRKFIESGIAPEKIIVKPHFIDPDPKARNVCGNYALYIGRISEEKGIRVLLDAWASLSDLPLKIIGVGPLLSEIKKMIKEKNMNHVEILGYCSDEECAKYLNRAKFVVVPSVGYDNFPRAIVEAYAVGVPVLASSREGIKEYIKETFTGVIFNTGDAKDLVQKARWFQQNNDVAILEMGRNARLEYEEKYTAQKNFEYLNNIYQMAIENYKKR
ncbi:MAG: glycosyltransferase family 4 protein [Candidatus Omnitrophota bacterium]